MLRRPLLAAVVAAMLPCGLCSQGTSYSGQWAITPTAQYSCAFGLVQFSIDRIQIADNYPSVSITLLPSFMLGALSGSFSSANSAVASVMSPGSCTETYTLSLTFTSADRFTGTLDANYTGTCFGCVRQIWPIAGVRMAGASYATFGAGCPGSLGVTHLAPAGLPRLGASLIVNLDNLPIGVAFMVTGWSNTISSLGLLPVDLGMLGMPGCLGRVSLDATMLLVGTGNTATYTLPVPNVAGLLGTRFYQQALVVDPGRNPLGGVTSDAAAATVGS